MNLLKRLFKSVVDLFRGIKAPMIPPLMVYFAAGVSAFTGIIEGFFVKESLTITVVGLASLGFWAGLPWCLKMPIGHLVDLHWKHKSVFVYIGAGIMAISILIMVGLTGNLEWMSNWTYPTIRWGSDYIGIAHANFEINPNIWYAISVILSGVGYVLQDIVADAMTVDAVPNVGTAEQINASNITMQTLGRIAVVGGGVLVAGAGGWLAEVWSYHTMYCISLVIPVISILGVIIARGRVRPTAIPADKVAVLDWKIIGGSIAFVLVSLGFGISGWEFDKEAVFAGSMAIILFLIHSLIKELPADKRREIWGIAVVIWFFRATPGFGAGFQWFEMDVLGFDESFFGTLRQIGGFAAIAGMIGLRGWMTKRPIPYLVVFLTLYSTIMMLPFVGMAYGLHLWTMEHLGIGAQTLATIDTLATDPLGQVAMIPMLAWIAREAPRHQKAIYFATMAAFSNLALSASSLGTKYLNQIFVINRGDYREIGPLLITTTIVALVVPIVTVLVVQWRKR